MLIRFDRPNRRGRKPLVLLTLVLGMAAIIAACTPDQEQPAVPFSPQIVSWSDNTVTLDLTHKGDDVGVIGFRLFRNTVNNFGTAVEIDVAAAGDPTTRYTDSGLVPGTVYYYWLKAYDAVWPSDMQNLDDHISYRSGETIQQTDVNGSCDSTSGTGKWRTAELCGVWQLIDPTGQVDVWNAVNVRGDKLHVHPLDNADVVALKQRFDTVRLALVWEDLQPVDGPISASNADAVAAKAFLDNAASQGIDVVLDPVHLSGLNRFGIPQWAWNTVTPAVTPAPNKSYTAWAGADHEADNVKNYLDELDAFGILTHPAVIAVEVVNEPHPRSGIGGGTTSLAQSELMQAYGNLISHVRGSHPDMLMVVGTYHGGNRHGGTYINGQFQHNHAATLVTTHSNLVWTAHNYFTGVGDTFDNANDGQDDDGGRAEGVWSEGGSDRGCYSDVDSDYSMDTATSWGCPNDFPARALAMQGFAGNAIGHYDYAQQASMPFFMGEWGMARQRYQFGKFKGYQGASEYFCDKIKTYRDIDGNGTPISWAAWVFDAAGDGFGLYNSRANNGDSGLKYAPVNDWVDSGVFPASDPVRLDWNWQGWANTSWNHADAFAPGSGC